MPPLNTFTRTCLAVAMGQAMIAPTQAASIVVNDPGDAVSNSPPQCTLRDAITSANTNAATGGCIAGAVGTDTITFDGAVGATISLTQASHLPITEDLTINGPSPGPLTIAGPGNAGVFNVNNATVSLNSLTITGGSAVYGGGIYAHSASSVNLNNSHVFGNSATAVGGGIRVHASSYISLSNSTVSGNSAVNGGGIYARFSNVNLNNSTVSGNSASAANNGGGIWINQGSLSLSNSTVSGNSARFGGGISAHQGTVNLSNSTVSGNSAVDGGGIYLRSLSSLNLSNSIVAGNVALSAAEIMDYLDTTTFTVDKANLFGNSSLTNAQAFVSASFAPGASDISATSDGTKPTALSSILSPLADNGGPTQTHALLIGSPALDAGDNTACAAAPVSGIDQRGAVRAIPCDIGAFEFQSSVTITVDSAGDTAGGANCTLRDALLSSNSNNASGGCVGGSDANELIVFDASVSSIALSNALPIITSDLTITGQGPSGLTIDANSVGVVLNIVSATVSLNSLTITGGSAAFGGGIYAHSSSNLSLSNSTVSGNFAAYGGGILAAYSSSVSLSNSTVSGNSASIDGGGIYSYASTLNLSNSRVLNNVADISGGGLRFGGSTSAHLSNSVLTGNIADYGGGLNTGGSQITLINTTVSNNTATMKGGGIRGVLSSISLSNSTVSGNLAPDGGGISVRLESSVGLINSTVSGNSASVSGGGISKGPNVLTGYGSSTLSFINSTVSSNSAAVKGGGIYAAYADINLSNTIVAGNVAPSAAEIENHLDASTFTADKANLFGNSSLANAQAFVSFAPGASDVSATSDGTKPTALSSILSPMTDNGGLTQTHALVEGSPAINAGNSVLCQSNMITLDQRGKKRDAKCDIGSYEFIEDSSFFVIPLKNGGVVVFSL